MLTVHRLAVGTAAGTAVLALAATGCGSSGNSSRTEKPSATTTAPAKPTPAAPAGATLSAAKVGKVGTVVTDSKGYVLYRFDQDTAKPSRSTCLAACAAIWPPAPAPATGALDLKGIDKALVGSVTRPDGTRQLTLAGWPLYRYAKDDEPREAYGQGAGGTWFAITPSGAKATSDTGGGTTSGGSDTHGGTTNGGTTTGGDTGGADAGNGSGY
ncbi:hypothetical protein ACFWXK_33765 [Streptomyces sp. NPDC059070]|uniref:hypothetical protein n=1 Tax=Streptomyces sp. NPDC059070 TaxID=3346713 RepID=UPI0036C08591